jgi:hypothetical protein
MSTTTRQRTIFSLALEETLEEFSLIGLDIVAGCRSYLASGLTNGKLSDIKLGTSDSRLANLEAILLSTHFICPEAVSFFWERVAALLVERSAQIKSGDLSREAMASLYATQRKTKSAERTAEPELNLQAVLYREIEERGFDPMEETQQRQFTMQILQEEGAAIPLKVLKQALNGSPVDAHWLEQFAMFLKDEDGGLYSPLELAKLQEYQVTEGVTPVATLLRREFALRRLSPENRMDIKKFRDLTKSPEGKGIPIKVFEAILRGDVLEVEQLQDLALLFKQTGKELYQLQFKPQPKTPEFKTPLAKALWEEFKKRGLDPTDSADVKKFSRLFKEELNLSRAVPVKDLEAALAGKPIKTLWLGQLSQILPFDVNQLISMSVSLDTTLANV